MGLCRYALLAAVLGLAVQSARAQTTRQRLVVFGDGLADNGDGGAQLYARSLTGNDTLVCFLTSPISVSSAVRPNLGPNHSQRRGHFLQQAGFCFSTVHLQWVLLLAIVHCHMMSACTS